MKIKINFILITFLLTVQFSCNKWLDLKPPEGLTNEEFWKTKEDVQSALMGAYSSFSQLDGFLFRYGEMRGDMVKADNSLSQDDQTIMQSNINPADTLCSWFPFYKVINYCNEVIKNAPIVKTKDNTFSEFQLDGFLSEAYFLRSLSYFYLVRIFKDVPLVLEPSETDDINFYLPKTDGTEVLNHIVSDLKAYRDFATIDGYATIEENKGRATKAAFDALLADISLWTFDYESCISYVENIENSGKYALLPSDDWFQLFYPGSSSESIFEFQYNTSLNQKNNTYGLTTQNSHNYIPSDDAVKLFSKETSDELKRGEDLSIKKYSEGVYIIWKYVGLSGDGLTERPGIFSNDAPWIVYQYADVLLMKAEALSQVGRYSEALDIINKIRFRAAVPLISIVNSATAFEDAILAERALELAFEGKRWFDLVRMGSRNNFSRKDQLVGMIVKNIPATQRRILAVKLTNPLGWYLPIYKGEIERNKNLVQNPYYNNLK